MPNSPLYPRLAAAAAGLVAAVAVAAASPARAADPMGVPDLVGARGLSLGAYRGVSAGNDGIYTNAAALASRRRYTVESQWLLDRDGSDAALQAFGASVVDSEGSVTGGFGYTRVFSGPWQGSLFHLPVAFPISEGLFGGLTAKYQSLDGPAGDDMRAFNADASLFWQASSLVAFGVAGYNLLDSGHRGEQPRAIGAGASVGDDRRFRLALDWRGDLQRRGRTTSLYAVGGEVLVADRVPLRAGYQKDDTRDASSWSAGIGLVTTGGFAIDLAYRQGIEDPHDRVFAAAVKLFVMTQ